MGEAYFCRRGSGAGSVAAGSCALICVKFPDGDICRCEKDGVRLTAEGGPGLAAFSVPEAGTWTVSITDGERVKSRETAVAEGDVKVMTLAYVPDELVILSPEGGLADGYSGQEGARWNGSALDMADCSYLSPAIDLTDYTAMTFRARTTYAQAQGYWGAVYLDPEHTKTSQAECALVKATEGFDMTTITVDISALTGPHYFGSLGNPIEVTSIVFSAGGADEC